MAQISVFAMLMDPNGGRREIGWQDIRKWQPDAGLLWLVGRPDGEETQRWLRRESNLVPEVTTTLLRNDNRPQCTFFRDGVLLCLRAASHAPQRSQDEMAAINLWIDPHRLIVIRSAPVLVFDELRTDVKLDHSPLTGIGDLLALIVQRITTRIEPLLIAIDDQIDEMEDSILLEPNLDLQQHLVALRHRIIRLRRHLVPQHEALSLFRNRRLAWLTDASRQSLIEEHSQMHQYLGDLDSMRERALLMQDEIAQLQNRKLNETMKIVAVFTAYLMPMNAITSLLGTNIEGIPGQAGTETPFGFFFEVAGLLLVLLVSYFIFKRLKWFD